MCLLSFYKPGCKPDLQRLRNGARLNKDGYGFAVVTADNRLIVGKGLKADDVIRRFGVVREQHPDGPAMFHSRYSTSGTTRSVENCHPFKIGRDKKSVVGHNGVLWSMPAGDARSDTRYFAESVMKPKGFTRLDKISVRSALEEWLGAGNKLVVLTVNRRYRSQWYILNEDQGEWVGDEWHSNSGHTGWRKAKAAASTWTGPIGQQQGYGLGYGGWDDDYYMGDNWVKEGNVWRWKPKAAAEAREAALEADMAAARELLGEPDPVRTDIVLSGMVDRQCPACEAQDAVWFGYCKTCGVCKECLRHESACLCYMPESEKRAERAAMDAAEADALSSLTEADRDVVSGTTLEAALDAAGA